MMNVKATVVLIRKMKICKFIYSIIWDNTESTGDIWGQQLIRYSQTCQPSIFRHKDLSLKIMLFFFGSLHIYI